MIVFSEGCSTIILMPLFPIFCLANPLHFHLVGFFPPSSASNILVSKVCDMDKLVSCLPVDSGALRLEGLDMRTLQMSCQLRILEDLGGSSFLTITTSPSSGLS